MLLSASPREQAVCAIPIRPLQHFRSAIAATSKSPRLTSRFTAIESACTNGLPLELFGPASHLPFLFAHRSDDTDAPYGFASVPMAAGSAFMLPHRLRC